MKIEDKELLLKDLCGRLPYKCRVFYEYVDGLDDKRYGYSLTLNTWCIDEFNANKAIIKPYLRPMSSMTEEERKEYKHLIAFSGSPNGAANLVDWLNKKMFAYRTIDGKDMFELGLALEAPKGMYNIK